MSVQKDTLNCGRFKFRLRLGTALATTVPMRLIRMLQLGCVTGAVVAPVIADEAADTQAKASEVLRATPTGVAPVLPGDVNASDSNAAYSAARDMRNKLHLNHLR